MSAPTFEWAACNDTTVRYMLDAGATHEQIIAALSAEKRDLVERCCQLDESVPRFVVLKSGEFVRVTGSIAEHRTPEYWLNKQGE